MSLKICQVGQESFGPEVKTMPGKRLSSHLEGSVLGSAVTDLHKQFFGGRCSGDYRKNKSTQTDYRDSECQTLPWEPGYTVPEGHAPEVLNLQSFTWGNGLPAGSRELEMINRMRMRRAWEAILPAADTPGNAKARAAIIAALEADEWAFREAEIQLVMDLRMELAGKLLESREEENRRRAEERSRRLAEALDARKQKELKNIRNRLTRELRKLGNRRRAAEGPRRRAKRDSLKLHPADLLAYSCAGRSRAESAMLDSYCRRGEYVDGEDVSVGRPEWLPAGDEGGPKARLCRRFAEREARSLLRLARLSEDVGTVGPALLRRKESLPSVVSTPRLSWLSERSEDRLDDAARMLQDIADGRAAQCEFLEGKNRCKELIEELQASEELKESKDSLVELSKRVEQRDAERKVLQENRVKELLQALEGKAIAKTLMFLNDELARLEGEKSSQALALLAERARLRSELESACEEGLEANRRRELDELFRQIAAVNRESARNYLEDVTREGKDWAAGRDAEEYARGLAHEIDAVARRLDERADKPDQEGLLADLVYNVVLPEVERASARRSSWEGYLRAAHAAVYDGMRGIDLAGNDAADGRVDEYRSASGELDELGSRGNEAENNDALPGVIELILDYSSVADENCKQEIYLILEEMLWVAKEKLMIFN